MKQLTINLTENAHPHAEIIAAKAADTELALFGKNSTSGIWYEAYTVDMLTHADNDFFLCLQKHDKECLHWLNGGDCLVSYDSVKDLQVLIRGESCKHWSADNLFMDPMSKITIKPKKQKRIVAVRKSDGLVKYEHFKDELEANRNGCNNIHWTYHEIEVEVTQ